MYQRTLNLILTLIFFLVCAQAGLSQVVQTAPAVDQLTYEQWSENDWDELIETGKQALRQGIDFYYLRYRMGIAYYEKGNYHMARHHFEKAHKMNPGDELLKEYLYYSTIYTGREYEASNLAFTFSPGLLNKLMIPRNRTFKQLYFTVSNQSGASSSVTNQFDPATETQGYQTISTGFFLFNAGLEHRVGSRVWFHHAYTYLRKNFFQYYLDDNTRLINPNDTIYINQYFLGTTALIKSGLDIRTGLHLIHLLNWETSVTAAPRPRTVRVSNSNFEMAGYLSLQKRINYATFGLSASFSNLNSANQYQQNASLTFFPFGNLKLYSTSVFTFQSENRTNQDWRNQLIYNHNLGFKLTDRLWTEAHATFGDQLNIVSSDGTLVYNDVNLTKKSYGLRFHLLLTKKINLLLDYIYLEKVSFFVPSQQVTLIPDNIVYDTHSISVKLLWKI